MTNKYWNPNKSKWKAAEKVGLDVKLQGNENVLYLGASSGTTIEHLCKKTSGLIFAVEISPHMAIKLVKLSIQKENIVPIFSDARDTDYIKEKLENTSINILFQDIPSMDQIGILEKNSKLVNKNCRIFLSLKTQSISQKSPEETLKIVKKQLEKNFKIIDMKSIEPYHQKHYFFILEKK